MATPKPDTGGNFAPPQNPSTPASGGPNPADPGNPNAPDPSTPSQLDSSIDVDQQTGVQSIHVTANGRPFTVVVNTQLQPHDTVMPESGPERAARAAAGQYGHTVQTEIQSIQTWWDNRPLRNQIIEQLYAAGLITSKKAPSLDQVVNAWATVVQEAALENQGIVGQAGTTPEEILAKAAKNGWNSINAKLDVGDIGAIGTGNLNNSSEALSQSQTIYKSYVDPATAMGTLADASYRLMGRNPTPEEYQAYLNSVYNYQEQENTGKFETKETGPGMGNIDPATGQPVDQSGTTGGTSTQTNVVSQRGIGTRGLQFLAGQQALANPETGAYQAATTYFNAFIKALSGPAAGMQASGPTTTIP